MLAKHQITWKQEKKLKFQKVKKVLIALFVHTDVHVAKGIYSTQNRLSFTHMVYLLAEQTKRNDYVRQKLYDLFQNFDKYCIVCFRMYSVTDVT